MGSGGNRLVELQNNDGGWDLPLDDGDPNSGSDPYAFAQVAMGLAKAYIRTEDPNMFAALQKAKIFLLSKTDNFTTADGALAAELDRILGGTACVDYVVANFYDKLATWTYYDAQTHTTHSTATYIQAVRERYSGGTANLAAWELGLAVRSAHVVGASPTLWLVGLKAEIDELDITLGHDVLGLAGAVLGLAAVGEDYDPQAGPHAAASSLSDLAEILASYQLDTGGFTWHAGLMDEGLDEMIQETTYATLALNEFDRTGYSAELNTAGIYIQTVQLATGGWENTTNDEEDNQITGEALWGMGAALSVFGDVNFDGKVDLDDFTIFALAWLTEPAHAAWNPDCDIAVPRDNVIDALDFGVLVDHWLEGIQ
jgi:hypothetical protein